MNFSFLIVYSCFTHIKESFSFPMHPHFILLTKSLSQADERCNPKHSQLVFDSAHNITVRDTESRVLIKNKLLVLKIIFMEAIRREKEIKLNEISSTSKSTN